MGARQRRRPGAGVQGAVRNTRVHPRQTATHRGQTRHPGRGRCCIGQPPSVSSLSAPRPPVACRRHILSQSGARRPPGTVRSRGRVDGSKRRRRGARFPPLFAARPDSEAFMRNPPPQQIGLCLFRQRRDKGSYRMRRYMVLIEINSGQALQRHRQDRERRDGYRRLLELLASPNLAPVVCHHQAREPHLSASRCDQALPGESA